VSASTHRQALCAVLVLYQQVLGVDRPWMREIGHPPVRVHIPVMLSRDELARCARRPLRALRAPAVRLRPAAAGETGSVAGREPDANCSGQCRADLRLADEQLTPADQSEVMAQAALELADADDGSSHGSTPGKDS
jgi:hypothetical protein